MRDYPTIEATCKEGKIVALNVPKDDAPNKRRFYALWSRGAMPDDDDG